MCLLSPILGPPLEEIQYRWTDTNIFCTLTCERGVGVTQLVRQMEPDTDDGDTDEPTSMSVQGMSYKDFEVKGLVLTPRLLSPACSRTKHRFGVRVRQRGRGNVVESPDLLFLRSQKKLWDRRETSPPLYPRNTKVHLPGCKRRDVSPETLPS